LHLVQYGGSPHAILQQLPPLFTSARRADRWSTRRHGRRPALCDSRGWPLAPKCCAGIIAKETRLSEGWATGYSSPGRASWSPKTELWSDLNAPTGLDAYHVPTASVDWKLSEQAPPRKPRWASKRLEGRKDSTHLVTTTSQVETVSTTADSRLYSGWRWSRRRCGFYLQAGAVSRNALIGGLVWW
jgi:hypothetical protein